MNITFFDVFSLFSIFQLSLFVVFLLHKGSKVKANKWLVLFFIAQAMAFVNAVISMSHYDYFFEHYHYLINIGVAFQLVWGPAYYLYIKALLHNFKGSKEQLIHFVPALLVFIFMLVNYQLASKQHIIDLHARGTIIFSIISYILISQLVVYNIVTIRVLNKAKQHISDKANTFFWAKFFVYSYLIGCVFGISGSLLNRLYSIEIVNSVVSIASHFYFFLFFNVIFYKALLRPEIFLSTGAPSTKYSQTGLNNDQINSLNIKLQTYIQSEHPYLKPGLTLNELSGLIGIPSRQLSQVINVCEKSNFSDYVNKLRIERAKELLADEKNKNTTVLEILYEVGFNSKTSFNTTFKKHTGLTPLQFRKNH